MTGKPSRHAFLVVLLAVALALSACGKKGNPVPPAGEPDTYPRVYPNV